jgi:hypothetical protein
MPKRTKYDGVVEAAHYTPDGQIAWVRFYERRGFVFTDSFMLKRQGLIERLESGERIFTGKRKPYFGSDFYVKDAVQLVNHNGEQVITTSGKQSEKDNLEDVPSL